MKNWFNTLNEALDAENLLDTWQSHFPAMNYDCNFHYFHDDGSKYGRRISIYRNEKGMYERPIHYSLG